MPSNSKVLTEIQNTVKLRKFLLTNKLAFGINLVAGINSSS